MKILETILLALTAVLVVIGIDQTITHGLLNSYFIFTFAVFTLLAFGYVKRNREEKEKASRQSSNNNKPGRTIK